MKYKILIVGLLLISVQLSVAAVNKADGIAKIGVVVQRGALCAAISAHNVEKVDGLLKAGANPNAVVGDGFTRTMLGMAVAAYDPTEPASKEVIELLLQAGALVNARTASQDYPLYAAVKNGWLEVVKQLLAAGATEFYGASLKWAIRGNNKSMIAVFIEHPYTTIYCNGLSDSQKQELLNELTSVGYTHFLKK